MTPDSDFCGCMNMSRSMYSIHGDTSHVEVSVMLIQRCGEKQQVSFVWS